MRTITSTLVLVLVLALEVHGGNISTPLALQNCEMLKPRILAKCDICTQLVLVIFCEEILDFCTQLNYINKIVFKNRIFLEFYSPAFRSFFKPAHHHCHLYRSSRIAEKRITLFFFRWNSVCLNYLHIVFCCYFHFNIIKTFF